jgi:hypothetical protein
MATPTTKDVLFSSAAIIDSLDISQPDFGLVFLATVHLFCLPHTGSFAFDHHLLTRRRYEAPKQMAGINASLELSAGYE